MADSDKNIEKSEIGEIVAKLKYIQQGFEQNLRNLHQKLEILDSKSELQGSLESFRKDAELKATDLEAEVKQLREDIKSIRNLLGLNLETNNSGKSY